MTQQSLITRLKAVEEALSMYHNFCHKTLGYSLEEAMVNFGDKALSDLRELIKEAEDGEARSKSYYFSGTGKWEET